MHFSGPAVKVHMGDQSLSSLPERLHPPPVARAGLQFVHLQEGVLGVRGGHRLAGGEVKESCTTYSVAPFTGFHASEDEFSTLVAVVGGMSSAGAVGGPVGYRY